MSLTAAPYVAPSFAKRDLDGFRAGGVIFLRGRPGRKEALLCIESVWNGATSVMDPPALNLILVRKDPVNFREPPARTAARAYHRVLGFRNSIGASHGSWRTVEKLCSGLGSEPGVAAVWVPDACFFSIDLDEIAAEHRVPLGFLYSLPAKLSLDLNEADVRPPREFPATKYAKAVYGLQWATAIEATDRHALPKTEVCGRYFATAEVAAQLFGGKPSAPPATPGFVPPVPEVLPLPEDPAAPAFVKYLLTYTSDATVQQGLIGEVLFVRVKALRRGISDSHAARVVGMLLASYNMGECVRFMDDHSSLAPKVSEALEVCLMNE